MPYFVAVLPMLAFIGVVGVLVALVRGRPRSAVGFGIVGVASAAIALALYYGAL